MRPDHLPLGSHLEGKLPPNLSRRALISPLLGRNSFGSSLGLSVGNGDALNGWLAREVAA